MERMKTLQVKNLLKEKRLDKDLFNRKHFHGMFSLIIVALLGLSMAFQIKEALSDKAPGVFFLSPLVNRMVYPNYEEMEKFWDADLKEDLDSDILEKLDQRGSYLYEMGNDLYPAKDNYETDLAFWKMVYSGIKENTKEIAILWGKDVVSYVVPSLNIEFNLLGKGISATGWNLKQFETQYYFLNKYFIKTAFLILKVLLVAIFIRSVFDFIAGGSIWEMIKKSKKIIFLLLILSIISATTQEIAFDYRYAFPEFVIWNFILILYLERDNKLTKTLESGVKK